MREGVICISCSLWVLPLNIWTFEAIGFVCQFVSQFVTQSVIIRHLNTVDTVDVVVSGYTRTWRVSIIATSDMVVSGHFVLTGSYTGWGRRRVN